MRKYYCVMVLYNKKLNDTIALKKLLNIQLKCNLSIYIIDNSTKKDYIDYNIENYSNYNVRYITMDGNGGLSRGYNIFLDELLGLKPDDNDIVVWLDDDTIVGEQYFNELNSVDVNNNEVSIFVPTIIGQDGIIWSPNEAGFLKNHLISNTDYIIPNDKFNAINSCTAVRVNVYKDYRYDERIFLDQVDHKFFSDQRMLNRKFFRLNTTVIQNFSQRDRVIDPKSLYNRLKIRFKDIIMYGKIKGGSYRILSLVKCCGLSFSLAVKVKSMSFFLKSFKLGIVYFFVVGRT